MLRLQSIAMLLAISFFTQVTARAEDHGGKAVAGHPVAPEATSLVKRIDDATKGVKASKTLFSTYHNRLAWIGSFLRKAMVDNKQDSPALRDLATEYLSIQNQLSTNGRSPALWARVTTLMTDTSALFDTMTAQHNRDLLKVKNAVGESQQDIATLTKEIAYYDNLLKNGGKISTQYLREQNKHIAVMAKAQGRIGNISNQLSSDYLAKWRDDILAGKDNVAAAKQASVLLEADKAGLFKTKENFRNNLVAPNLDPSLSPERQKQISDRILGRVSKEIDEAIREDDAKMVVISASLRRANASLAALESKESRARQTLEAEKAKLAQNYSGKQEIVGQLRAAQQEAQLRYDQSVLDGVQQRREVARLAIEQAQANIRRARREQDGLILPAWR